MSGTFLTVSTFLAVRPKEAVMKRRVDREKIERADRESRMLLDDERKAREAKTARLRAQRLAQKTRKPAAGASNPPTK